MGTQHGSQDMIFTQVGELRLVLEAHGVTSLQREGECETALPPRDVADVLGVPAPSSPRVLAVLVGDRAPWLLGESVDLRATAAAMVAVPALVEEHLSHLGLRGLAVVDGHLWFVLEGGAHAT